MLPLHAFASRFLSGSIVPHSRGGTHTGGYAWYPYGRLCLVPIRAAMPGTHTGDHAWYTLARSMTFLARDSGKSDVAVWEAVFERENLRTALKRVESNKGAAGIDGMEVKDLSGYLKAHWLEVREALESGKYRPSPVRRVEIPKPDGGVRQLGIPTVLDRLIQQAIAQVLTPMFEVGFSRYSYGFRPGRSAHQAVQKAQEYIQEGYNWVVDIDLEKFFDRVNHDMLMARVARVVKDKRVLKLIRAYLES